MDKIAEISAPNNDNMAERLGRPSIGHGGNKLLILPILIIVILILLIMVFKVDA